MRTLAPLSALALLLASSGAIAENFDAARIDSHIKTLSSDEFEGRGPATPGEQKTVAYLVEQLQAAGVEPGGEVVDGQRQWTQRVPLLKSDITGAPALSVTSAGKKLSWTQGNEIAVRSPLNGQS